MLRRLVALIAAAAIPSSRLTAQATPTVPPSAQVYRDLDRMASLGLIDTLLIGVRPLTEREIVLSLQQAKANVDRNPAAREWSEPTIAAYLRRFSRVKLRLIDSATIEAGRLSSLDRAAPSDLNGSVDADINPLAANRGGRPLVDGATFALETSHSAILGPHLALSLNPRFAQTVPSTGTSASTVRVQTGSVNALFGDFAVQVGRDYVTLGQSPEGGLLLSDNAPPLDMVRIWNDRAWRVPFVSRVVGRMRGSAFVADLGASRQLHPHTRLIGYHVATLPHPQLEFGFQVVDAMGGQGGQPATFWNRFLDAIPVVDALRTSSDFQFSNKLAGIDLHWRMPRWRGFELYAEGNADDFDGRDLARGFLEDAGYLIGTSFSCLVSCGRVGVRAEYHQTGIRYYTHFDYPMSKDGLLLGDPLGPRGIGGYVTVDADARSIGRFALSTGFEARSGNTYRSATTGPSDAGFHFELVERRPSEKRARLLASWTGSDVAPISMQVSAGIERVSDFNFVAGVDRTNWLARVAIVGRAP
jgi:hypothetical protein